MAVLFLVMQVGGICLISDPAFLSSDCHRVLQQTQRGTIAVISRFSPATTYIAGLFGMETASSSYLPPHMSLKHD